MITIYGRIYTKDLHIARGGGCSEPSHVSVLRDVRMDLHYAQVRAVKGQFKQSLKQIQLGCSWRHVSTSNRGFWQIVTNHQPQIYCQAFYKVVHSLKLDFIGLCSDMTLHNRLSSRSLNSTWCRAGNRHTFWINLNSQLLPAPRIWRTNTLSSAQFLLLSNTNAIAFVLQLERYIPHPSQQLEKLATLAFS